jgi:hypothetical protein
MPTSCPIKQNPVHIAWEQERSNIRSDLIYTRTVVQPDYAGELFRPSKRYAKSKKRKCTRHKKKRVPVYGTMGSYSTQSMGKEKDEAHHHLSATGNNTLYTRSVSSTFSKTKRTKEKRSSIPWGRPLLQPLDVSVSSIVPPSTFSPLFNLKTSKSCTFGTTERASMALKEPAHTDQLDVAAVHLAKSTNEGKQTNKTWRATIIIQSVFRNVVPRPCSKAFSVIAQNMAKSNNIEERIRKKHRMRHQKKRLEKVRNEFARRYSQVNITDGRLRGDTFRLKGDSWTLPFNVEGSYESPFLGTNHHTRNVTVLSPVRSK